MMGTQEKIKFSPSHLLPAPASLKGKKISPLDVWWFHWLYAYSIPRHSCHHFLPQLIPFLQSTPHVSGLGKCSGIPIVAN